MSGFRLLPVLIFSAVLMLTVKLGGLWQDLTVASDTIAVAPTQAQQENPAPQAGPDDGQGQDGGGGEGEGQPVNGNGQGPALPPPGATDPTLFTQSEIDLLQKLAVRREELDQRASELEMREGLLEAAEKRIDQKVAELQRLKQTIEGLIDRYDEREKEKMQSLVKIYENMKADEAARIFEELEMPILLGVIANMREQAAAAILAEMDPKKAKAVTQALAERRQLPEPGARQQGGQG